MTQEWLKKKYHYNPDTGIFTNIKNGKLLGSVSKTNGYMRTFLKGKEYKIHRLVWLYLYGALPSKHIDHINHNRADNRLCNLREVTRSVNHKNKSIYTSNSSGTVGVVWHKNNKRWVASIGVDGSVIYLGSFVSYHEAVDARKNAEVLYGFHDNHGKGE